MTPTELKSAIEAIVFAAGGPVELSDLADVFSEASKEEISERLEEIRQQFNEGAGGFRLEQTGGGFRFVTSPELDPYLRKFFARKSEGRLSMAALETLAIVAYRQPVTAPEVSDIRSVNSAGVLRTLLERKLIRIAGRKNVVGSPFLYRTTREFLTHFGLNDLEDLPKLEEFAEVLGENLSDDFLSAIASEEIEAGAKNLSEEDLETGQHGDDNDSAAAESSETSPTGEPDETLTANSETVTIESESEGTSADFGSMENATTDSSVDSIDVESPNDDRDTVESVSNENE